MRLATFSTGAGPVIGVVVDDEIVELARVAPGLPPTLAELLAAGDEARAACEAAVASGDGRVPLSAVRLLAPIPRPPKFFAVGLNYREHAAETKHETATVPTVFSKLPNCVIGPFDEIERPRVSDELDYEGELAFVIGTHCRHVSREAARRVIAGYLVVNDVTVRDWQRATSQWVLGKSFATHGPMGPWLVTSDEVRDPHALTIRTFVNGERRQESSTSLLIHDCYALVEHLSRVCALEPGDVVATGTPAGAAAYMTPPRWLTPGDVVRVEIDRLGAIENRVTAERRSPGE